MQRVQAEAAQQLSSLQTDMRVSYGNDALMPDMPDSTPPLDALPPEQDGLGFIHPESFNQANTDNHGTDRTAAEPQWRQLHNHIKSYRAS